MILPGQVIRALEALAEHGYASIDGSDRELFARAAADATVENLASHEFELASDEAEVRLNVDSHAVERRIA